MESLLVSITDLLNNLDKKLIQELVSESDYAVNGLIECYHEFLKQYHPDQKRDFGMYYTPQAVISFILRSIFEILSKKSFSNITSEFGHFTFLDPAMGMGQFIIPLYKMLSIFPEETKRITLIGADLDPISCVLANQQFIKQLQENPLPDHINLLFQFFNRSTLVQPEISLSSEPLIILGNPLTLVIRL